MLIKLLPTEFNNNIKAFTLAELSIVIVITSLIIAGVTAGKQLVASSQLRKTTSDIGTIITAVNSFKTQFNAYPGDIKNFSSYYTSCVTTTGNPSIGSVSCNGNGDGQIDASQSGNYENLRIYQHLTLAKLYPGSFDGVPAGTFPGAGIGANNTPFSLINNGNRLAYAFWRHSTATIYSISLALAMPHFNTTNDSNNLKPYDAATTGQQMQYLDTKLDDGQPLSGNLIGHSGMDSVHACIASSAYDTQYKNEINCRATFIIKY